MGFRSRFCVESVKMRILYLTKIPFFSFFKPQRAVFAKFQLHKSLWLFLSDFQKSRFFGDFGHFSSKFAHGTHFWVPVKCRVEVFQTNVANFPIKTRILTSSTQNRAQTPFGAPRHTQVQKGPKMPFFGCLFSIGNKCCF